MATIETYATPTLLFRYRSLGCQPIDGEPRADPSAIQREMGNLRDQVIYCPRYRDLNDAMEGLYRASERVADRQDYDDVVETVRDEKLNLGIASFSESWDNELMWAHYADHFRGICIAYSVPRLLDGLDEACALARVAYGDKPYYLNLPALRGQQERARAILSTKNLKWSYEREWRLFAPSSGPAHYTSPAVRYVYLGVRMPVRDRTRVRKELRAIGIEVRRTLVDGYTIKRLNLSSR